MGVEQSGREECDDENPKRFLAIQNTNSYADIIGSLKKSALSGVLLHTNIRQIKRDKLENTVELYDSCLSWCKIKYISYHIRYIRILIHCNIFLFRDITYGERAMLQIDLSVRMARCQGIV